MPGEALSSAPQPVSEGKLERTLHTACFVHSVLLLLLYLPSLPANVWLLVRLLPVSGRGGKLRGDVNAA